MDKSKMTKLADQVEYCLQYHPSSRNSDITLWICIVKHFYGRMLLSVGGISEELIPISIMYKLPNQDNVKRIRAKLNSEGKYWPTDIVVAKKRLINMSAWLDWLNGRKRAMAAIDKQLELADTNGKCEEPGCNNDAVIEWKYSDYDEDGINHYYTMRCEDHPPVDQPEYQPNPI